MIASLTYKSLLLLAVCLFAAAAEKCIPGRFHKKTSSPASEPLKVCQAWSKDACCTESFTNQLYENVVKNSLSLKWGHCKNLTKKCEEFILAQQCFYSCEPSLIKWHTGVRHHYRGLPVCGDYCDDWYDACKDDQACVENWSDVNSTSATENCPRGSECRTFKQIYGNGKNLCEKIWGPSYTYVPKKCPCARLNKPVPAGVDKESKCSGVNPVAFLSYSILLVSLGITLKA